MYSRCSVYIMVMQPSHIYRVTSQSRVRHIQTFFKSGIDLIKSESSHFESLTCKLKTLTSHTKLNIFLTFSARQWCTISYKSSLQSGVQRAVVGNCYFKNGSASVIAIGSIYRCRSRQLFRAARDILPEFPQICPKNYYVPNFPLQIFCSC